MNINKKEVEHTAELAKLKLSNQEIDMYTKHLEKIFDMVNMLDEVNTDDVEPTYSMAEKTNTLREDISIKSSENKELIENSPVHTDELIKVPNVLNNRSK